MKQLVLNISDDSLLPILKNVIKAFPGIRISEPKATKKDRPHAHDTPRVPKSRGNLAPTI